MAVEVAGRSRRFYTTTGALVSERIGVWYVFKTAIYGQLDGCIVSNAHNTVFGSKRSPICTQAVYLLHSTRPSVK